MSVSDSITDLPPCSPLIFGGAGQWRGSHSGTVGFKLKRLSGSFKSHRKWCHSLKDTYWEFPFFFQAPWDCRLAVYYHVITHLHLEE